MPGELLTIGNLVERAATAESYAERQGTIQHHQASLRGDGNCVLDGFGNL